MAGEAEFFLQLLTAKPGKKELKLQERGRLDRFLQLPPLIQDSLVV